MLNCRDVSKLVSESHERKLSLWQRVNLWMHLSMCGLCWRFRKDMLHLHDETHQLGREVELDEADLDVKLPDESKDRIKKLLESRS